MDRATLDATLSAPAGQHSIRARPDVGGAHIPLTDQQLEDLITVHLADWLEQARSAHSCCTQDEEGNKQPVLQYGCLALCD